MVKRLDEAMAKGVLARHGLVEDGEPVTVRSLSGGVSSTVLLVEATRERYVLKQPRPEFATEDRWVVDTGRGKVEFEVGRFLFTHLGREIVPILAYDHVDGILIMKAAPRGWKTWKERLLAGEVRTETGKAAGRLLARLHGLSLDLEDPDLFRHDDLFQAQRIHPYFTTAAERAPEARAALGSLSASFFGRYDLVHGDFSPKNLFVDPAMETVRLIDHEVATRGDAAFDVGFCLTHLVMKGIHLPEQQDALHEAARSLLYVYQEARADDRSDPLYEREARIVRWLGACLLARAIGKSRAEYLTADGRDRVRRLGLELTLDPPKRLDDALDRIA